MIPENSKPENDEAPGQGRSEAGQNSGIENAEFITQDGLRARLQQGELVCALDYAVTERAMFPGVLAQLRDEIPAIRPQWKTLSECHLDGTRVRQKVFGLWPKQRGNIDVVIAVFIGVATFLACAWWPL